MKKFFTFLVAAVYCMSMWAYDFKSGDLYYNITNDTLPPFTASVTYEKSSSSANYSNLINVEIPATATFYDGTIYHITSIGSSAFNQCKSLVSVTIPESVTQIANNAFSSCSSLTNVIIPTSVVSIGRNAFSWCSSLALIDIPNNVSWVGDAAFSGTPWYNNQPDGVIYAGLNLYRYKGEMPANTSIQVNEGTKSISEHAFSTGCSSLVSIDIPNSVSCIGYAAFSNCSSLTSISIPESIKRIETWTFSNCSSLDTIILPDSITFIGSEAFKGCTLLTSVTIPENVEEIEYDPFAECPLLTSIVWNAKKCDKTQCIVSGSYRYGPFYSIRKQIISFEFGENIEEIPPYLCYGMKYMKFINIPESVMRIGEKAFYECANITELTIPHNVSYIDYNAFYGCSSISSVIWNAKKCNDFSNWYGSSLFLNSTDNLTSFIFGDSVQHIPSYLCYYMKNLTTIEIPHGVTSLGEGTFQGCESLDSIIWNAKVCKINSYNTKIPFDYNVVTSFVLGDSVELIPDYLCYRMNLTSITIPSTVTQIGKQAFYNCSNLDTIICNALTPPTLDTECFYGVSSNIDIYIPCGTLSSYSSQMGWRAFSNFIEPQSEYRITLTSNNSSYGSTNIEKNNACEMAQISATANSGYQFVQWNDGVKDNPRMLTVISDTSFVAEFSYDSTRCIFYTTTDQSIVTPYITTTEYDRFGAQIERNIYENGQGVIVFNNTVTNIGKMVFYNCSTLTSIIIPKTVQEIGKNAFNQCNNLSEVVLQEGLKTIGHASFSNCTSLTNIIVPNSVTMIDVQAFANCTTLSNVTIGSSVQSIGESAFLRSSAISTITCLAEIAPYVGEYAFYEVSKMIPIYVPCGAVSTYQVAYGWNQFYNIQEPLSKFTITTLTNDENRGQVFVDKNTACDNAQISATAYKGYHFTSWSDGNTDNPRIVELTQDTTFTAEFAINTYNVVVNAGINGTVTNISGVYNYGDTIKIVATPNEHYHFVQWSDDVKDNPRTIIVDQDISIEAEFEINTYKVTATCNSDFGVVTGSGTYNYGEHITLTATPNEGYEFVQWSDGVKDNPRTIIVDQDISIEAEFVPTTAVENVLDGQLSTPKKYLLNGQLIILRDDKKYTIMGQEVK